jgi:hypothetical protein
MDTRTICHFHCTCQRCSVVTRRQREIAARQRDHCDQHREDVSESQRVVHCHWVQWMDSWSYDADAGVRWSTAFDAQIAEVTARRS